MSVASTIARCANSATAETLRVGLKTLAERRSNGKTDTQGQEIALTRAIASSGLSEADKAVLRNEVKAPPLPAPPKARVLPQVQRAETRVRAPQSKGVDWSKMVGEAPQTTPDDGSDLLTMARMTGLAGFRHQGPIATSNSGGSRDTLTVARNLGLAGLRRTEKSA